MATKKTKSTKKSDSSTVVTRIKAVDTKVIDVDAKPAKSAKAATVVAATTDKKRLKKPGLKTIFKPFIASGRYFKGAWVELRQVRWPTRRATWGLTGAVLAYTAFFVIIVLLLDAGFKYVFELILGK